MWWLDQSVLLYVNTKWQLRIKGKQGKNSANTQTLWDEGENA